MEYAAHGVVPVLQRTYPYINTVKHEETGLLFKDVDECISTLERLLNNPKEMKRIAQNARNYVLKERMMFQHIKEREKFYLELIEKLQPNKERIKGSGGNFLKIRDAEGAVSQGDYVMLTPSNFETAVRNGLSALAEGNRDEARYYFSAALEIDRRNYLPYLYCSECVADKNEKLRLLFEAIKRNPYSIMARWMLNNLKKTI